jgi:MSHA biogenesis protein MshM
MYLEHFGLREAPFRITPHTEFFFAGANRGATLEALVYAITHDEGIVKVSGEVGSGKTMLCRMLLEKLPENVETVYLANPSLSRHDILHAIAEELKAPLTGKRANQLLRALQDQLLAIYAAGRQVVVMVDEAHAMPPETLEEIRLLSNLESNRHKLLHIVLFGQPELDEHLSQKNMRQLKERITHNFALDPFLRSDIGGYLMFRLRAAGYHGPDLFTPSAIQLISHASEGLTRRINILADKALLSAFSENKHQIDAKQVNTAIRDAQFNPMLTSKTRSKSWLAGPLILVLVAALAYFAGNRTATTEALRAAPVNAAPVPSPTDIVRSPDASAQVVAITAQPSPPAVAIDQAPSFDDRLAASDEWLKSTPDTHYFIQLLSVDGRKQRDVELFLAESGKALDPLKVRVYRSRLSGRNRLGVIYGDYPSEEAANADLATLSKTGLTDKPYVRSVRKLR